MNWVSKFMKRNNLTIRAVSFVGQKFPVDWEDKMKSYINFISEKNDRNELHSIENMDEVPVTFDMLSKFTVEERGSTDVRIATCGAEKIRFIVVLCVTADFSRPKVSFYA